MLKLEKKISFKYYFLCSFTFSVIKNFLSIKYIFKNSCLPNNWKRNLKNPILKTQVALKTKIPHISLREFNAEYHKHSIFGS